METNWKEILKFSQKELRQAEKEKLCESLSWMEADDIELNFTDLKTLFRLAQDILKYKSEQVNSLLGKKMKIKTKEKSTITDSPAMSSDSILETIAHQEEVINANKDIIEQLYTDIAELEGRKNKYEKVNFEEQNSESSRNTLSEMNAVAQLENEISKRNKHIRKLLNDVKILEEENTTLRDKLNIFKEKLKESTLLIENLTEQLFALNTDNTHLRDILGKTEHEKSNLIMEFENLKKDLHNKDFKYERVEEDVKTKQQQFKNLLKSYKAEIDRLVEENVQLKEELNNVQRASTSPNHVMQQTSLQEEIHIKKLQEKLTEASEQMIDSATVIKKLKDENKKLKSTIEEMQESVCEQKNICDDGKERQIIKKLKNKVKILNDGLRVAEEMIVVREKELTEIASQLQLLRSDEGINALIEGIKTKKRHLKIKDEGIKNLVQEINQLNELVDDLQLENESMRQELQIPANEKVATHGILKKCRDIEKNNIELTKKVHEYENKLISLEIENRDKSDMVLQLEAIIKMAKIEKNKLNGVERKDRTDQENVQDITSEDAKALIEENEGLRNGLTEILNFMKDNNNTCSGILSLECPSLEALLNSMEARKSSGWFSPHMKTVMELKAALGGRDALLKALHESRKENYQIMSKLRQEEKKILELEITLQEIKTQTKTAIQTEDKISNTEDISIGEFGTWILNTDCENIDIGDQNEVQNILIKGNILFESKFKQALQYFQSKFKILFDKFTTLAVTTSDEINKYSIQEERFKAEIENLKSQIDETEDDTSNQSPGLINMKTVFSERKYNYLVESYKQIRTLNENIKNELLENKKERLIEVSAYESKIQNLILSTLSLTDKLRDSIPVDLFSKQNSILNNSILKYRKEVEHHEKNYIQSVDLENRLDEDKLDIIHRFQKDIQSFAKRDNFSIEKILSNIEQSVLQKQLKQICIELQNKNNEINKLEMKIIDLQTTQSEIINRSLHSVANEEINFIKEEFKKLQNENKILKEHYYNVHSQLDVTVLQLNSLKTKESNKDVEINTLRHQILDLQSTSDDKTIIARLSGEILLYKIQASESEEKVEVLKIALNKEKLLRAEVEEILTNRQKVFNIYTQRYDTKIRNLNEILDILRRQYQGSLPLISIENFLDKVEEFYQKSCDVNEKLKEIEDLRSDLITKHTVYSQVLDLSSKKCFEDNETCTHKLKNIITEETRKLEIDHYSKRLQSFEQSHQKLLERCNFLEKTLILVNQGFQMNNSANNGFYKQQKQHENLEIEDVNFDEDPNSLDSHTVTLSHPKMDVRVLKQGNIHTNQTNDIQNQNIGVDRTQKISHVKKSENRQTQTTYHVKTDVKTIQTDSEQSEEELKTQIKKILYEIKQKDMIIDKMNATIKHNEENLLFTCKEKDNLSIINQNLKDFNTKQEETIRNLESTNDSLRKEINTLKLSKKSEKNEINNALVAENQSLLQNLKKIENDKNEVIKEYNQLLNKERDEYTKSLKILQTKLKDLQNKLDKKESEVIISSDEVKETNTKNSYKIFELQDKCFKLESDLETRESEFKSQQSEMERWKNLASERLIKMEQLSAQIKERHNHEMESYKAESQHWLTQVNEMQREHMELRTRLTEQKTLHLKQIAEKDGHIDQLRCVVNNLKSQIVNMQTMISVNDPSFDLSAIVEVEEASDGVSQQSDRLELKFDSSADFNDIQDEFGRIPCTSTSIWQEPVIERLRREKQLMSKQNALLRRQIKALAARERRSRLDAQNLKNQVFRISTNGHKVPSAESAALQSKVVSLQTQLASARRDATSSLALWDKCKRAQQAAEKWQARYEEKCQEVTKLEMSLNLAKSAISRLEKEKRILISRLNEDKHEKLTLEKHDVEIPEKTLSKSSPCDSPVSAATISSRALLDRVEAQQRRIAALELAEKGNETLVSEYEKSLAEITALKGQLLKLESTLLEAQIRSPLKSDSENLPELEYWKNYCNMLKEENSQLTLRISSLETIPTSTQQHRVNDLEQTVLTLRGVVRKLAAENKIVSHKRFESKCTTPTEKSGPDKVQSQVDSYKLEISNLKRSILEKDALLEKSKDMLKIAAEREEQLLAENTLMRRRLEILSEGTDRLMSA